MEVKDILELFKVNIEALNPIDKKYLVSKGNQNGFEELVPEIAKKIKSDINNVNIFDYTVHLGHHFPDMDLVINQKRYGLELKSRNNGSWDTNGNSVFESITDEDYEEIFLLFGSKEPNRDHILVKYDYYWKVTTGINVTHSPRFKINMNASNSVFANAEEYNNLREMNEKQKVIFLQTYLKKNTSGIKWFVPQSETPESVKPTSLNSLPITVQDQVKSEVLVLFPQDLITSKKADYTRAHEFIISNHFYYSSSFRDFFSAGGKWKYNGVEFPQSVGTLYRLSPKINEILSQASIEFQNLAYQNWEQLNISLDKTSFVKDYYKIIDFIGEFNFSQKLNESKINNLSNLLSSIHH